MDPTVHVYRLSSGSWCCGRWPMPPGIIMQLYCLARSFAGRMSPIHDMDIRNVTLYWSFHAVNRAHHLRRHRALPGGALMWRLLPREIESLWTLSPRPWSGRCISSPAMSAPPCSAKSRISWAAASMRCGWRRHRHCAVARRDRAIGVLSWRQWGSAKTIRRMNSPRAATACSSRAMPPCFFQVSASSPSSTRRSRPFSSRVLR